MKVITRSGLNFVIGLIWQKDDIDNKISIRKVKKSFDFALYAKTAVIEDSYCFLPNSSEANTFIHNNILLYSLTIFVLESIKEIFSGVIEDSFVCFKIDENSYGSIFIYKGGVIAHDGEIIGNKDDIKEFILRNANRYNILVAHVLRDVDFLVAEDFLAKNGIELVRHDGPKGEQNASELYLWQHNDRFNNALKKALLKKFSFITKEQQMIINKIVIIIIAGIIVLFAINSIRKWWASRPRPKPQLVHKHVAKPQVVPINNQHGVPLEKILSACFTPLHHLPKYLEIENLDCSLTRLNIVFSVHGYEYENATQEIRNMFAAQQGVVRAQHEQNNFFIQLSIPLNLNKIPPPKLPNDRLLTKVRIEKLALIHDMKANFSEEEITESVAESMIREQIKSEASNSIASTVPAQIKEKKVKIDVVTLTSPYSPFYLKQHNVLDQINIYNILMHINENRVATWIIKGEYSND